MWEQPHGAREPLNVDPANVEMGQTHAAQSSSDFPVFGPRAQEAQPICPRLRDYVAARCPCGPYVVELWPRTAVHVFLYVGTIVNFGFVWTWISGLLNMQCGSAATIRIGSFPITTLTQCGVQVAGIIIFGSSFIGAVEMIMYYDDAKQSLLKKKRAKMVVLSAQMEQTLSDSLQLVSSLLLKLKHLSEQVLIQRWYNCRTVLRKCKDDAVKKKLANIFLKHLNGIMAKTLDSIKHSQIQDIFEPEGANSASHSYEKILWTHDNPLAEEAARRLMQVQCRRCKEEMKPRIGDYSKLCAEPRCKKLAMYECPKKGCDHVVCEEHQKVYRRKMTLTSEHYLVLEVDQARSTDNGNSTQSLYGITGERYTLLLHDPPTFRVGHDASTAPKPKDVLKEMLMQGADYWFAQCLLVKPWENWVHLFKENCDKFTGRLRDAGVFINLTRGVLERQVVRREAVCEGPGGHDRFLAPERKPECITPGCGKGAQWSCPVEGCPRCYCEACKVGLPTNRRLQAIYTISQSGNLQRPIWERSEVEESGSDGTGVLWEKKVLAKIDDAVKSKTAEALQYCAVAELVGQTGKDGFGTCCECEVKPWKWHFCLPCSFLREWSSRVGLRTCYTNEDGSPRYPEPDDVPRCSLFSPTKRCVLFCYHVEINSYLHERLIIGACFSLLYFSVQVVFVVSILLDGCSSTFQNNAAECYVTLGKKILAVLAMAVYFVNTLFCLRNLEHLDLNVEIVKDIKKLEELRGKLEAFNELKFEAKLLDDVFDRVVDDDNGYKWYEIVTGQLQEWEEAGRDDPQKLLGILEFEEANVARQERAQKAATSSA